jgi:hypothetical protein
MKINRDSIPDITVVQDEMQELMEGFNAGK